MANDKAKGVTWLLDLASGTFKSVELPYVAGNHETAVSADGSIVAVPQYEEVTEKGQTEGGAFPGHGVSLIDLRTGAPSFARVGPNPFGRPRPHDAVYLDDGTLIMTAQEANGFSKFAPDGTATAIAIDPVACNTPHLIRLVPHSRLAVSGCRCTNAGCKDSPGHPGGNGSVVVFDVDTGDWNALPMGPLPEGLDVTEEGDVWVGSNTKDGYVQVFTFGDRPREVQNLRYGKQFLGVPYPLRVSYDTASKKVAVASMSLEAAMAGGTRCEAGGSPCATGTLRLFDAPAATLEKVVVVETQRGVVNMEGLRSFANGGQGYFVSGGFDTQTIVVLDSATLETVMSIYMPRCSNPRPLCKGTPQNAQRAKLDQETGWNNWSGGLCPATLRNPLEQRWMTLDGFNWSPVVGDWAGAAR
jgi:hypothetical protein